jgi:hypothetical protein
MPERGPENHEPFVPNEILEEHGEEPKEDDPTGITEADEKKRKEREAEEAKGDLPNPEEVHREVYGDPDDLKQS